LEKTPSSSSSSPLLLLLRLIEVFAVMSLILSPSLSLSLDLLLFVVTLLLQKPSSLRSRIEDVNGIVTSSGNGVSDVEGEVLGLCCFAKCSVRVQVVTLVALLLALVTNNGCIAADVVVEEDARMGGKEHMKSDCGADSSV